MSSPLPIVFLFSGQGSQYPNMGRELYQKHPTHRFWLNQCWRHVESDLGVGLDEFFFSPSPATERPLRTAETGAAIFALNFAVARTLISEGCQPSVLLGYSLGELIASAFAGYAPLQTVLSNVARSSRLIERLTPRAEMLAVLDSIDRHEALIQETGVHLASVNYDGNFVVTGLPDAVQRMRSRLQAQNTLAQPLAVRCGFHSPLIDSARDAHQQLIGEVDSAPGQYRLMSSALVRDIRREDINADYFWDVIRKPVNFRAAVEELERSGPWLYIDVGPSGTLAAFVKHMIRPGSGSKALPLLNQFGQNLKGLERVLSETRM